MRPIEIFFFFQAEDGIRDYKVTGVQTCALPIFTGVSGRTEPKQSVTLFKVTVICCTSETPVKFTVIVLPLKVGGPETVPVPVVTVALPLTTLLVNVKTKV